MHVSSFFGCNSSNGSGVGLANQIDGADQQDFYWERFVCLHMFQTSWPNSTPALQIIMMPSTVERPRKRPKATAFRNWLITQLFGYRNLRIHRRKCESDMAALYQISSRTLSESTVQAIFDRLGSPRARDSANFVA
jgi:hypothetical protein